MKRLGIDSTQREKNKEAGIYNFVITSRAKAAITVAVGDRETQGEVLR